MFLLWLCGTREAFADSAKTICRAVIQAVSGSQADLASCEPEPIAKATKTFTTNATQTESAPEDSCPMTNPGFAPSPLADDAISMATSASAQQMAHLLEPKIEKIARTMSAQAEGLLALKVLIEKRLDGMPLSEEAASMGTATALRAETPPSQRTMVITCGSDGLGMRKRQ